MNALPESKFSQADFHAETVHLLGYVDGIEHPDQADPHNWHSAIDNHETPLERRHRRDQNLSERYLKADHVRDLLMDPDGTKHFADLVLKLRRVGTPEVEEQIAHIEKILTNWLYILGQMKAEYSEDPALQKHVEDSRHLHEFVQQQRARHEQIMAGETGSTAEMVNHAPLRAALGLPEIVNNSASRGTGKITPFRQKAA